MTVGANVISGTPFAKKENVGSQSLLGRGYPLFLTALRAGFLDEAVYVKAVAEGRYKDGDDKAYDRANNAEDKADYREEYLHTYEPHKAVETEFPDKSREGYRLMSHPEHNVSRGRVLEREGC